MNRPIDKYLLSNVLRAPDDAHAAAEAAPAPSSPGDAPAAAAAETSPAQAAAATPAQEPAQAADAAPAAPTSEPPKSEPSLLEATAPGKPDGEKPAGAAPAEASKDAKPAEGDKPKDGEKKPAPAEAAKPDEGKPAEAAPAEPAPAQQPQARQYDAFATPEGVKLDTEQVKGFTDILDDPQLDHQGRAQKLIDLHVAEVRRIESAASQHQLDVWKQTNDGWRSDWKSDPELGGNRMETVLGRSKAVIEQFGGTKEQQGELLKMLSATGMGNHKSIGRLLNNIYDALGEPSPVPASTPGQRPRSWKEKAYGGDAKA